MGRWFGRFRRLPWWGRGLILLAALAGIAGGGLAALVLYSYTQTNSGPAIRRWFDDRASRAGLMTVRREPCPGAPFLLPTDGFIGLLWRDPTGPYNIFRRHPGVDIFGDGEPGAIPVRAAYDGYLTRLPDWVASVIIRHDDPLQPGRVIWTYYTHMASQDGESFVAEAFPPGTSEVWVEQGTVLGYQGNYSGSSLAPTGLHLHFSVVKSEPDGSFKNEGRLGNTLDPSPYLGMTLNSDARPPRPIDCAAG